MCVNNKLKNDTCVWFVYKGQFLYERIGFERYPL